MGKNLVILGADFSANGIKTPINLNPNWTNNQAWVAELATLGDLSSSSIFKTSNKVELPLDAAKLYYTRCIYTTSGGGPSHFGLVFWDSNDEPIVGDPFPTGERGVTEVEISIPATAKYVSFTYFMETETPFKAIVSFED